MKRRRTWQVPRPVTSVAQAATKPPTASRPPQRSPSSSTPPRSCARSASSPIERGSRSPARSPSSSAGPSRRPRLPAAPPERETHRASRAREPEAETFGLSARERGVLAEIVAGRTNREIGQRLYISEKTVGVHVGNILAKLGVAGRVEAATVALRLGLVDDLAADARRPGPAGPGPRRGRRREP